MLLFASSVKRFFRFREISFRLRFREPFSFVARSVYAPPRFQSQQLFPFRETFVSPWSQSFFFNREERLCSPSLQESTVFFVSAKFHFACVSVNRFPSSRRGKLP